MEQYTQIIVTIVGVLGSASIWKYLEARLKAKNEYKKVELENNDGVQYRDDLKNRVRNLEAMLASSSDEKDELRKQVLDLVAEVHALRVEVDYLKKENERLKNK
jgi:predicted nuclease with TOPRIM domain